MSRVGTVLLAAVLPASALADGIATRGVTGGLTIPSGNVLASGEFAYGIGNFEEALVGQQSRRINQVFGIGLAPNFEIFGRFAEYQNPLPGSRYVNGPRDVSVNAKLRLPQFWSGQPSLAVGLTDIGGGASFFGSTYFAASGDMGPLGWTLGYARGGSILGSQLAKPFSGPFGGVEVPFGRTGLSALAEYDGHEKHVGLRYRSAPVAMLGGTRFEATVQRSAGTDAAGRTLQRNSAMVSAVVPFGEVGERQRSFAPQHPLPPLETTAAPAGATPATAVAPTLVASTDDRLQMLARAVARTGLERVRTGMAGDDVVVEYENQLFLQTEADALGVVLGLASELAPPGARRVRAVVLKTGLPVYVVSTGIAEYRRFLRTGDGVASSGSLAVDRPALHDAAAVRWSAAAPTRRSFVQFQVEPEEVHTIGTEVGAFDYSIGAVLKAFVPLWRGAEFYTSVTQHVASSENFQESGVFAQSARRGGLRAAAIQQTFWLHPQVLVTAGAGRYRYDRVGAVVESTVFIPGRDDVVRLKGAVYDRSPLETRAQATPMSASYRWVPTADTWVEAGWQRYTDGTFGPALSATRWFGDVSAALFLRRGGTRTFGGLELTIPLTPRRGLEAGPVRLNGAPQFLSGVRTRIRTGSGANFLAPNAVRDFPLEYSAEVRLLNGGRSGERYFITNLHRMREAFYVYARESLPQ